MSKALSRKGTMGVSADQCGCCQCASMVAGGNPCWTHDELCTNATPLGLGVTVTDSINYCQTHWYNFTTTETEWNVNISNGNGTTLTACFESPCESLTPKGAMDGNGDFVTSSISPNQIFVRVTATSTTTYTITWAK